MPQYLVELQGLRTVEVEAENKRDASDEALTHIEMYSDDSDTDWYVTDVQEI